MSEYIETLPANAQAQAAKNPNHSNLVICAPDGRKYGFVVYVGESEYFLLVLPSSLGDERRLWIMARALPKCHVMWSGSMQDQDHSARPVPSPLHR